MSAPRRKRTRLQKRPGITRRTFLKGLGFGTAAIGSTGLISGCTSSGSDNPASPTPTNPSEVVTQDVEFLHGVASGDPAADRVILWTRITPENPANTLVGRVDVYRDENLTDFVRSENFETTAQRDFTVKVDFDGLAADTIYFYRFVSNGKQSITGRTRTTPAAGNKRPLNFGVVSCSSLAHGFFNAYGLLAERDDLDAVLHLGDYIYEYGTGEYGNLRPYEPATEIITLADYRTRHAQYKRDADLQKLHARVPFITIWDDHESTNNSYRDGAENHTEGVEGVWEERKGFSQQVYDEWMPIRLPEANNPGKIFRRLQFGDLVDMFMLDTRLFDRDLEAATPINPIEGAASDADRKMIGPEQFDFLVNGMRNSNAQWKLIGNQVVFHQWSLKPGIDNPAPGPLNDLIGPSGLNGDSWDGYAQERKRIIDAIRGTDGGAAVDNVVILTGDVHSAWVADITDNPNQPVSQLGGYNPLTGEGSVAVEFVVTSITSPGLPIPNDVIQAFRLLNPHIKHINLTENGYSVLRVSEEKTVCEYWAISTITQQGATEALSAQFEVANGAKRISGASLPLPLGPLAPVVDQVTAPLIGALGL